MARSRSTAALESLIAALTDPGSIDPGLARRVSDDAARVARPALHRRVPAGGSPLSAFSDIDAASVTSPYARL